MAPSPLELEAVEEPSSGEGDVLLTIADKDDDGPSAGSLKQHPPANKLLRLAALGALVVQNSAVAITIQYSRSPRAGAVAAAPYLISSAVVSSECLKLCLSLSLLYLECRTPARFADALRRHLVDEPKEFAKLLIPAGP